MTIDIFNKVIVGNDVSTRPQSACGRSGNLLNSIDVICGRENPCSLLAQVAALGLILSQRDGSVDGLGGGLSLAE
jgi:hypothetical protein